MPRRQLARKSRDPAAPNLKLVPPPKPKRRPRRKWKIGRIFRPPYGSNPALLVYEEELVLAAVRDRGGSATIAQLTFEEPYRWRSKFLWATVQRLRTQGRLDCARGRWRWTARHTSFSIREEEPDGPAG